MKIICKFVLAGFLLASGAVWADGVRVAYVDIQKVMEQSAPAQHMTNDLQGKFGPRDAALTSAKQKLEAMQADLEKSSLTMSPAQHKAKEQEFQKLAQEYEAQAHQFSDDLNQARTSAEHDVAVQVQLVVKQIAEKQHFDLVVQNAIYATKDAEITDQVIQALADPKP